MNNEIHFFKNDVTCCCWCSCSKVRLGLFGLWRPIDGLDNEMSLGSFFVTDKGVRSNIQAHFWQKLFTRSQLFKKKTFFLLSLWKKRFHGVIDTKSDYYFQKMPKLQMIWYNLWYILRTLIVLNSKKTTTFGSKTEFFWIIYYKYRAMPWLLDSMSKNN